MAWFSLLLVKTRIRGVQLWACAVCVWLLLSSPSLGQANRPNSLRPIAQPSVSQKLYAGQPTLAVRKSTNGISRVAYQTTPDPQMSVADEELPPMAPQSRSLLPSQSTMQFADGGYADVPPSMMFSDSNEMIMGDSAYDMISETCDSCGDMCGGYCGTAYPGYRPCGIDWTRFTFFAGSQAFTNSINYAGNPPTQSASRASSGSFGFHQGFNWGGPLPGPFCGQLSGQFGLRATQNNFNGAEFTEERRHQLFLTAGAFRRVDYGFQGGVAVDYLNDNWYAEIDLVQIRCELSFVFTPCHEAGFRFASGSDTSLVTATLLDATGNQFAISDNFTARDNYRFYYRYRFGGPSGGYAETMLGFTDDSELIANHMVEVPLMPEIGLQVSATYLHPRDSANRYSYQDSMWNMSMSFVWTPGRRKSTCVDYSRPLFDVSDNGTFLVQRTP